jgi:lipopolysaccharide biosynthesis glycosyltransferase
MLIPEIIPHDIERVVYLDADVIVLKDLSLLWTIDMADHAVMAVENFSEPTLRAAMPQLRELFDPDAPHFNAGVLLINVPRWREQMISRRAFEFLQIHGNKVEFADQDALNAVLAGSWGKLDPIWNVQLLTLSFYGHRQYSAIDCRRRQEALLHGAAILHYTGRRKPWNWLYAGLAEREFFRELNESDWFGRLGGRAWSASRTLSHLAFRGGRFVKRSILGQKL